MGRSRPTTGKMIETGRIYKEIVVLLELGPENQFGKPGPEHVNCTCQMAMVPVIVLEFGTPALIQLAHMADVPPSWICAQKAALN